MKRTLLLLLMLGSAFLYSCGPKEDVVTISTSYGDIVLLLYDETPLHKANFVKLANEGFYDSTTFHRVMDGFMIQGGDPNSKDDDPYNDGMGSPGYTIDAEFNPELTHIKGALAAARQPDAVNPQKASSGSQFYIVEEDDGTHFLDNLYTIYGQTIYGLEVIDAIADQQVDPRNRPFKDIFMTVSVQPMSRKKITKEYGYEFPSE